MPRQIHTVEQGEQLSAIAAESGFRSFVRIWNSGENAQLRAAREDPHQLLPGDEVVIPDVQPAPKLVRKAGGSYTFVAHVEKLKLRFKLLDVGGQPATAVSGKLTANGEAKEVTTDGEGMATVRIARDCTSAQLAIAGQQYELVVGGLAPISEPSGQAARLMNLGYWYGDDGDPGDADALALAIELFQKDDELRATGDADEAFIDKLAEVHDGRG